MQNRMPYIHMLYARMLHIHNQGVLVFRYTQCGQSAVKTSDNVTSQGADLGAHTPGSSVNTSLQSHIEPDRPVCGAASCDRRTLLVRLMTFFCRPSSGLTWQPGRVFAAYGWMVIRKMQTCSIFASSASPLSAIGRRDTRLVIFLRK